MLIDCEAFDNDWWPRLAEMRPSGGHLERTYKRALIEHNFMSQMPLEWECWDGKDYTWNSRVQRDSDVKDGRSFSDVNWFTIHYTNMNTQPWKPLPGMFPYPPHPHKEATYLFWEAYAEALEKTALGLWTPQTKIPTGIAYADIGTPAGVTEPVALPKAELVMAAD